MVVPVKKPKKPLPSVARLHECFEDVGNTVLWKILDKLEGEGEPLW